MTGVTSSASAPQIFDRTQLRHRQQRALRSASDHFLLARAAEDLIDRLSPVRREFSSVLDLGTPLPDAATKLRQALPAATLLRAASFEAAVGHGDWLGIVADEEALPVRPEQFDLAVSLLALHAVNDLPGAMVQIRRALKPDGLFLACLLGGQTLVELRECLVMAEAELKGGASPRVAPFSDLRDLGGLLQRAGFALPVTDVEPLVVRYDSPFGLFADLRAMGSTNVLVGRQRAPTARSLFMRAAALYAERFADPDGRIRATFELVWLSGWAPHESQQKPLRPGSARMSLADALNRPPG